MYISDAVLGVFAVFRPYDESACFGLTESARLMLYF